MLPLFNALLMIYFISINLPMASQNLTQNDQYVCPPCGDGSCDNTIFTAPGTCPVCGMTLIKKDRMKNVAIFVHDGVEILDFSGPGEVFAAARPENGGFKVYTVSLTKEPIISQGFVKIIPEYSIADVPTPDILVIPGGNSGPVANNPQVTAWIRQIAPDLEKLHCQYVPVLLSSKKPGCSMAKKPPPGTALLIASGKWLPGQKSLKIPGGSTMAG